MKILKIASEELIPLSGKQQIVLLTLIACVFQFVFFYAPALADQAAKQSLTPKFNEQNIVINDSIIKTSTISPAILKFIGPKVKKTSLTSQAIKKTTLSSDKPKTIPIPPKTIKKRSNIHKVAWTSVRMITAYNSEVAQTDNDPCITANGFNVCRHNQEDTIAANFLKFGTKVKIPSLFGDRIFIVRDRMNKKNNNRVDIWMKNKSSALKFGVKITKIQIIS